MATASFDHTWNTVELTSEQRNELETVARIQSDHLTAKKRYLLRYTLWSACALALIGGAEAIFLFVLPSDKIFGLQLWILFPAAVCVALCYLLFAIATKHLLRLGRRFKSSRSLCGTLNGMNFKIANGTFCIVAFIFAKVFLLDDLSKGIFTAFLCNLLFSWKSLKIQRVVQKFCYSGREDKVKECQFLDRCIDQLRKSKRKYRLLRQQSSSSASSVNNRAATLVSIDQELVAVPAARKNPCRLEPPHHYFNKKIRSAVKKIQSEKEMQREAEVIASKLFRWLLPLAAIELRREDFSPYLTEEDLAKFGEYFQNSEHIHFCDLLNFVSFYIQSRNHLAESIKSIQAAARAFDMICSGFCVVLCAAFVALLYPDLRAAVQAGSAIFFGSAFVFGQTVRGLFEALVVIFIAHPFDIGDFIKISPDGQLQSPDNLECVRVLSIGLLAIGVKKEDGSTLTIPNNQLTAKTIYNMNRSTTLYECITLLVSFAATSEQRLRLKEQLQLFTKLKPELYKEQLILFVDSFEVYLWQSVVVLFEHNSLSTLHYYDPVERNLVRSEFLTQAHQVAKDLGIEYQPIKILQQL